jgi:V/A-type H+-transporting ATPase subunit I
MSRVQIIGTQDRLDQTLRALHRLGTVQIDEEPHPHGGVVDRLTLSPEEEDLLERLEATIARVDAMLSEMPDADVSADAAACESLWDEDPDQLAAGCSVQVDELTALVQPLARRHDELEAEREALPRYEATVQKFLPLSRDVEEQEWERVPLLIDRRRREELNELREQLDEVTDHQFQIVTADVDEEATAVLVAFDPQYSRQVRDLLWKESVSEVRLPEHLVRRTPRETLTAIKERDQAIPGELEALDEELATLGEEWAPRLLAFRWALQNRLAELQVRTRLGVTARTFVITGWMPQRDVATTRKALQREVGDTLVLEEVEASPEELHHAPSVLSNPPVARNFEFFMGLLSPPTYGTLDPTILMAIFFPIFFGFILGDVAYGLIILAAAFLMIWRLDPSSGMQRLARILVLCGIWSTIFGILFGEFFGSAGEIFGMQPIWFHRGGAGFLTLIIVAVAMGAIHIFLGFVLGVWNAWVERKWSHLIERAGMLVLLFALFLLVLTIAGVLPEALLSSVQIVAGVLLAGSLVVLAIVTKVIGLIEVFGTIGNILSYIRLAAIGISSVYLAEVANELGQIAGNELIGIIIGVLIAAVFHTLNIVLGVFSPSIHSMRLHFVEFFGKFYESGGHPFHPFAQESLP